MTLLLAVHAAATWALVLALPFLVYLCGLLRAAESDGGWLSTTALVAGVSGIVLKIASHAPELLQALEAAF